MKDILKDIIKYLRRKGVDYADLRWVRQAHESIVVENVLVENISTSISEGCGIRTLLHGHWGFASSLDLTKKALQGAADKAVEMARASGMAGEHRASFPSLEPVVDSYRSPYEIDPFEVPLNKKLDYLFWACQVLRDHPNIKTAICMLNFYSTAKLFLNTEGSVIEQEFIESGGYIEAKAVLMDELQKRSYPISHQSQLSQAGYEYVKALDLVGGAERVRKEAVALLRAKECPSKKTTLILDGSQLALQVHESCGHPTELDRVLGEEMSFAGSSFLTPEKLGKFKYGSRLVNITANATSPGGVGSFGYDDEGTRAQRQPLVKDGVFVGYLSSRETAARLGLNSSGAMRAESWNMIPIVRMTNINLEPGDATLDELIQDTKDGILMATNKSWSIDDKRLNFQFGTEIAWEIKNGKLGRVFKNPLYTGITPEFWKSCTGIADANHWKLWGIPNCAKGEPMQLAHVGHGTSPARFESVTVGRSR